MTRMWFLQTSRWSKCGRVNSASCGGAALRWLPRRAYRRGTSGLKIDRAESHPLIGWNERSTDLSLLGSRRSTEGAPRARMIETMIRRVEVGDERVNGAVIDAVPSNATYLGVS